MRQETDVRPRPLSAIFFVAMRLGEDLGMRIAIGGKSCNIIAVETLLPGLLEQAVERLKSEFQPEQIWLFGSHAWGRPTEHSDVDLMVIVPSSDERPIRRMQRAQRCLRGISFAKDVLVNTRPEFDRYRHLKASLSHKIFEQGRKLYG